MSWNVRDYGALGDGTSLDTEAIQAAIDSCHAAGGGRVEVPAGDYVIGCLQLRSRVELHLSNGARLLSSLDMGDFPFLETVHPGYDGRCHSPKCLLFAEEAENIAVTGRGTIDGRWQELDLSYGKPTCHHRPQLIHFRACRRVCVRDVSLINAATWVQHYLGCEDLVIDGITVDSRENRDMDRPRFADHRGLNQDGLDIDGCRKVRVSNCFIDAGDDALCLKSHWHHPCEHVTVSNCVLASNASAIKLGTESQAGFRNIVIGNCVVREARVSAIAIMSVDGAICENVLVHDIVIDRANGSAIFLRLGERCRPWPGEDDRRPVGAVRDIVLRGITAHRLGGLAHAELDTISRSAACAIMGIPRHPIERVSLSDIHLHHIGGGSPEAALQEVPECSKGYPSITMCDGDLPCYGIYARHVAGLDLRDIHLHLLQPDSRPATIFEDVTELRQRALPDHEE